MSWREVARKRCLEAGAIKRGGGRSDWFFDAGKLLEPPILWETGTWLLSAVFGAHMQASTVCGVETLGATFGTMLALRWDRTLIIKRKTPKQCGTSQGWFAGPLPFAGTRVLIVDDVLTTGSAVQETVAALNGVKLQAAGLMVLLDRREVREELGISVASVLTLEDVT